MTTLFSPTALGPLAAGLLFLAILASLEFGRQIGLRARARGDLGAGISAIDSALFALLGLVIAFTFAGASTRFEARRDLIRQEANAIGTAYLRLDLLPAEAQPLLRQQFRAYVDARLASFNAKLSPAERQVAAANVAALQAGIWTESLDAARQVAGPQASTLLLPALNEMIDITTTRSVAAETHPPLVVYIMLVVLTLACSLIAGAGLAAGQRRQQHLHILSFAVVLTLTIFVIIDLEFPRVGFIRIDAADHIIADTKAAMKP